MESYKNLISKLKIYADQLTDETDSSKNKNLSEEDNNIITSSTRELSNIISNPEILKDPDYRRKSTEVLDILLMLCNHEIDHIRIAICKCMFKIIKDLSRVYKRAIFVAVYRAFQRPQVESARWALIILANTGYTIGPEYRRSVGNTMIPLITKLIQRVEAVNLQSTISEVIADILNTFGYFTSLKYIATFIKLSVSCLVCLTQNEPSVIRALIVSVCHSCLNVRDTLWAVFYVLTTLLEHSNIDLQDFSCSFRLTAVFKLLSAIFDFMDDLKSRNSFKIDNVYWSTLSQRADEEYFNHLKSIISERNENLNIPIKDFILIIILKILILLIKGMSSYDKSTIDSSFKAFSSLLTLNLPIINGLLLHPNILNSLSTSLNEHGFKIPFESINIFEDVEAEEQYIPETSINDSMSYSEQSSPHLKPPSHRRVNSLALDQIFEMKIDLSNTKSTSQDEISVGIKSVNENNSALKSAYLSSIVSLLSHINHHSEKSPISMIAQYCLSYIISFKKSNTLFDTNFRTSLKLSALSCFQKCISIKPDIMFSNMDPFENTPIVFYKDILLFFDNKAVDSHLLSTLIEVCMCFLKSSINISNFDVSSWSTKCQEIHESDLSILHILDRVHSLINANDSIILLAVVKFYTKLSNQLLLIPECSHYIIEFIHQSITLSSTKVFQLKLELLQFYTSLNYRLVNYVITNICTKPNITYSILMRRNISSEILNSILLILHSCDISIRNAAMNAVCRMVYLIPLDNENHSQNIERLVKIGINFTFVNCDFYVNNKNYALSIDWLHSSTKYIIGLVIRSICTTTNQDDIVCYISCLIQLCQQFSPYFLPYSWSIKYEGNESNRNDLSSLESFHIFLDVLMKYPHITYDAVLHINLLKIAVECLGGYLIRYYVNETQDSQFVFDNQLYITNWNMLFDKLLLLLNILTSVSIDNSVIESQGNILLKISFFKSKQKGQSKSMFRVGSTPQSDASKEGIENFDAYKSELTKQISAIYEAHMFSISKPENDKYSIFGITLIHCIELMLLFSSYQLVSPLIFELYLNLSCLTLKFPTMTFLCLKQLIYIFTYSPNWISFYRLNDCSLLYHKMSSFILDDPEWNVLHRIRSRQLCYTKNTDGASLVLGKHPPSNIREMYRSLCSENFYSYLCMSYINLPDHPIIKSSDFDTPNITIFENFIFQGLRLFFHHSSFGYQSLILDILELLITLQMNYTLLDFNGKFLALTQNKYENLLTISERIPPYFSLRLFRFWNLLNNAYVIPNTECDSELKSKLKLTSNQNLLSEIENLISSSYRIPESTIMSILPLAQDIFLIKGTVLHPKIQIPSVEAFQEVIIAMIFKCYEYSISYSLLKDIIKSMSRNEGKLYTDIITSIFESFRNKLFAFMIPVENTFVLKEILELFDTFSFTTIDIKQIIFNQIYSPESLIMPQDVLNIRWICTICIFLRQYLQYNYTVDDVTSTTLMHISNILTYYDSSLLELNESIDDGFLCLIDLFLCFHFINILTQNNDVLNDTFFIKDLMNQTLLDLVKKYEKYRQESSTFSKIKNNQILVDCIKKITSRINEKFDSNYLLNSFLFVNYHELLYIFYNFTRTIHKFHLNKAPTIFFDSIYLSIQSWLCVHYDIVDANDKSSNSATFTHILWDFSYYQQQRAVYSITKSFYTNYVSFEEFSAYFIQYISHSYHKFLRLSMIINDLYEIISTDVFLLIVKIHETFDLNNHIYLPLLLELDEQFFGILKQRENLLDLLDSNLIGFKNIIISLKNRFKTTYSLIHTVPITLNILNEDSEMSDDFIISGSLTSPEFLSSGQALALVQVILQKSIIQIEHFIGLKITKPLHFYKICISYTLQTLIKKCDLSNGKLLLDYQEHDEFSNCKFLLKVAISFIVKYVESFLEDFKHLYSSEENSTCSITELVQVKLMNVSDQQNIIDVILSCQQIIFPPTIFNLEINLDPSSFRNIYLFSLILSSCNLKNIWCMTILIKYSYELLSMSLRIKSNLQTPTSLEILLLSKCIDSAYSYFSNTYCLFDLNFVPVFYDNLICCSLRLQETYLRACCKANYLLSNLCTILPLQYFYPYSNSLVHHGTASFLYSFTFYSFIYNVSRHPMFSSFMRIPPALFPDLLCDLESISSDKWFPQIPHIPFILLKKRKNMQEYISRHIKLGWSSKQNFMECIMCILSGINELLNEMDWNPNTNMTKTKKNFTSIISDFSHLLPMTLGFPYEGDPLFGAIATSSRLMVYRKEKDSNKINSLLNLVNHLHERCRDSTSFQWAWIERSMHSNFSVKYENIEVKVDQNDCESKIMSQYTAFMDTELLYSINHEYSYTLRSIHFMIQKLKETTESTASISFKSDETEISYTPWFFEKVAATTNYELLPILKPLLDYHLTALNLSNKNFTNSPSKFFMLKSLLLLTDVLPESYDFKRILDRIYDFPRQDLSEDYVSLKYLILLGCKSLALLHGEHKFSAIIPSLIEQGLSHSHPVPRISAYIGLLYIFQACPNSISNIKQMINVFICNKFKHLPPERNKPSEWISVYEQVMLISLSTYISLNLYSSDSTFIPIIDAIINSAISHLTNPDYSTFNAVINRVIVHCVYQLISLNTITYKQIKIWKLIFPKIRKAGLDTSSLTVYPRNMSTITTEDAKILIAYFYMNEELFNWSTMQTGNTVESLEDIGLILKKIRFLNSVEANILSATLSSIIPTFIEVENILNRVIFELYDQPCNPNQQSIVEIACELFQHFYKTNRAYRVFIWTNHFLTTHAIITPFDIWLNNCFFVAVISSSISHLMFPVILSRIYTHQNLDIKINEWLVKTFMNTLNENDKQELVQNFNRHSYKLNYQ